jgi:hypothetical protein
MLSRWLVVPVLTVAVAGCSKREQPKPEEPATGSAAPIVAGNPDHETDEALIATAEALEAAAQRGEGQWTRTVGHDLIINHLDGALERLPFPAPKHGHGDSVTGIWLAPDDTLFAVGSMITGVPGPDTGAVHRLQPGGKQLERVLEVPERELYGVWGRSASDVYAVGPKVVMHWDGAAWSELPIDGVVGTINHVTGTAAELWITAVTNDPEERGRVYRRTGSTWQRELEVPCVLRGLSIAATTLYAAGACNTVFRRAPDGTWTHERVPQSFVYDVVASSDSIVYAAATQLLRRASDGTWAVVDVDLARAYGVYPGRNGLVFALGNYPSPDGKSAIAFTTGAGFQFYPLGNCDHPAGSVERLYCVRERVEKSPPPPDLR